MAEPVMLVKPFRANPMITAEMINDGTGLETCPVCGKGLPTIRGKWSHVRQKHPEWPKVSDILGRPSALDEVK